MLEELYHSTVKSLATAIAAKDQYAYAHIHRVQHYAIAIAEALKLTGDAMQAIRIGAILHDIGKLGVPDYVLLKPGRLTTDEFDKIKRHPIIGADILEPVNFPWPVSEIVRNHHERWDGTGYPDGLAGEAIPLGARIVTVADVYDALISDRSHRQAWPREKAIAFLAAESGRQFDPLVVTAFLKVVDAADASLAVRDAELHSTHPGGKMPLQGTESADNASRQISRNASELWVLYEVSQTLNSLAPMQERLMILSQKLSAILPGATCAFLLYDSASATQMLPAESALLNVGEGTIPLVLPLAHNEERLGTITFYHRKAGAFTTEEEHFLSMIASKVQVALYQDREHNRTRSDADTDALTGLHNLRYLRHNLNALLKDASISAKTNSFPIKENSFSGQFMFSLLYLDLDYFKNINTLYGHSTGSRILTEVARLLPKELRPNDIAVRYGGDEFVIVLPQTSAAGAQEVATRIRAAIQKYRPALLPSADNSCVLDISIGIASYPSDGIDIEELVALADQRMYAAKQIQKTPGGHQLLTSEGS